MSAVYKLPSLWCSVTVVRTEEMLNARPCVYTVGSPLHGMAFRGETGLGQQNNYERRTSSPTEDELFKEEQSVSEGQLEGVLARAKSGTISASSSQNR